MRTKGLCDLCGRWRWSSQWTHRQTPLGALRICHRHKEDR